MSHGDKQERKLEQAIAALLAEPTIARAAASCGVSEATLWRWLQQPDFQRDYRAARRQLVESALATLQTVTTEAVETLRRNLTANSASVQVRAAVAIIEHSVDAVELIELENRIKTLEERAVKR